MMLSMANEASVRLPWLVLRHVAMEHIGTMAPVLARAGIEYRYVDVFRGEQAPETCAGLGGLIVMGGPMGVYDADRYPFLTAEMSLIRRAAEAELPVLGVCLGSQLIAGALGARVYPGPQKEIGWFPIEVVDPSEQIARGLASPFMGFHWHGDTFDLPAGAVPLFRSALYPNQGFRWGRNVYALQFHLEVDRAMIAEWLVDPGCCAEMGRVPGLDPNQIREQTAQYAASLERLSAQVFTRFLELTSSAAARHGVSLSQGET
jgi:GMP synthase (glutamine-hydrolysing)